MEFQISEQSKIKDDDDDEVKMKKVITPNKLNE